MTTIDLQKARMYKDIIIDDAMVSLEERIDSIFDLYIGFLFNEFDKYSVIGSMINDSYVDENGDDISVFSFYGINGSLTYNMTKKTIVKDEKASNEKSFISIAYKCFMINYIKSMHMNLIENLEERVKKEQNELKKANQEETVTNE